MSEIVIPPSALTPLLNALNATGLSFAHYGWSKTARELDEDHGVVAENGGEDFIANDIHLERATTGTVDYFTRDNSDSPRSTIEAVLNQYCAWQLNSVQFEEDTGYIHYEWVVGVYG